MSKFTIVWNEGKNEGVIFRTKESQNKWDCGSAGDALHAAGAEDSNPVSSLADHFKESYASDGEICTIQNVDIDESLSVNPDKFDG